MSTAATTAEACTEPNIAPARWTGGQYSLFRGLLGCYLCGTMLLLIPRAQDLAAAERAAEHPILAALPSIFELSRDVNVVYSVLGIAAALCIPLALGWKDRLAAVALWYLWACLYVQQPAIVGKSLPAMGWIVLAHVCTPTAPFGSIDALGRADPRGAWRLPDGLRLAVWTLLVLMQGYFGWLAWGHASWRNGTAVQNLLQSSAARDYAVVDAALALPSAVLAVVGWTVLVVQLGAGLAVFSRVRPFVWLLLVLGQVLSLVFLEQTNLALGMLVLLVLAFDPAWVQPTRPGAAGFDWLFYDGNCGLCHRSVRLVLAEEPGETIHFAPLGSQAFERELPEDQRQHLPDSVVVKTSDELLVRSRAAIFLLRRLGGWWRVLGELARVVPRALADKAYDLVAAVRHKFFRKPSQACPLLPPDLRRRFELADASPAA